MKSFESGMIAVGAVAVLIFALLGGVPPVAAQEVYSIEKDIRVETGGAYLGIEMEDVTTDNMASYKLASERGVIVRNVVKGSPAEAAGLQEKDVILQYAGTAVFSARQMSRLVRETPVGRKVELAVSRDGKPLTLTAKIGKRERGARIAEEEPDVLMFGRPGGHTSDASRCRNSRDPRVPQPPSGR